MADNSADKYAVLKYISVSLQELTFVWIDQHQLWANENDAIGNMVHVEEFPILCGC